MNNCKVREYILMSKGVNIRIPGQKGITIYPSIKNTRWV